MFCAGTRLQNIFSFGHFCEFWMFLIPRLVLERPNLERPVHEGNFGSNFRNPAPLCRGNYYFLAECTRTPSSSGNLPHTGTQPSFLHTSLYFFVRTLIDKIIHCSNMSTKHLNQNPKMSSLFLYYSLQYMPKHKHKSLYFHICEDFLNTFSSPLL